MKREVYIPSLPTRWDAATHSRVPSLDLNPAEKYGDLINMTTESYERTQDGVDAVLEAAENIGEDDLILCVGDVVLCAAAIAQAARQNGKANVLRWDKNRRGYEIETVVL